MVRKNFVLSTQFGKKKTSSVCVCECISDSDHKTRTSEKKPKIELTSL